MTERRKFGENHAKAMAYQGLAELGNALTTDSNVTQRHLEHGIYGVGDPPTSIAPERTDVNGVHGSENAREPSVVERHVAEARGLKERAAAERDAPSRQPEMER